MGWGVVVLGLFICFGVGFVLVLPFASKMDCSSTDFSFRLLFIWCPYLDKVIYDGPNFLHFSLFLSLLVLRQKCSLFLFYLYRRVLMLGAVEKQILGNMSLCPP